MYIFKILLDLAYHCEPRELQNQLTIVCKSRKEWCSGINMHSAIKRFTYIYICVSNGKEWQMEVGLQGVLKIHAV